MSRINASFLREIQSDAVAADSDVATLLRKCKILAARLGNAEFKEWIDRELNGYDVSEELPAYRILNVNSFGYFSGLAGSHVKNAPIPLALIPDAVVREHLSHSYLRLPISSYASLVGERKNCSEKWPANVAAVYGENFYQHMNLISARKEIPFSCLVGVVDTIKTRVLNFVLEIEAQDPDAGEAPLNQPPLPQDKVSQVFHTTIIGTVQNVSTGGSNVTQTATATYGASDKVLSDLLAAVRQAQADPQAKQIVEAAVEKLQATHGGSSFGSAYTNFMAVLSDHFTVYGPIIAPFLPALAAMVC